MALAFLFSRLAKTYRFMKLGDYPFDHAHCFVVDHQLRENSADEAASVRQELRKLDLKTTVLNMRWDNERQRGLNPPDLPNVESLARTYRYRLLGRHCAHNGSKSLFFAHHRDDQYETVLMRILSGHGYRGLQGIREANEIPECYDLHRVYKSGLIDDQLSSNPFLSFKPPNRELKRLRWLYRRDVNRALSELLSRGLIQSGPLEFAEKRARALQQKMPYLTPLSTEDDGVTVFRPLLAFDKDRLIATCEANNVTWFEDVTNKDPTLTTRNAIRHLVTNHELPKALQKPAILNLCQRARKRVRVEESEAQRLLARKSVIKDLDSNVGTLTVELPRLGARMPTHRTLWAEARERARTPHRRTTAAILIRKLIEYVTPEDTLPPLTSLDNAVDRLFPQLSQNSPLPAKAFSIAGVLFSPTSNQHSANWFLSRAPYSSSQTLPMKHLSAPPLSTRAEHANPPEQVSRHVAWRGWKSFKLWDGRFWVMVHSCVHASFYLHPLYAEHLKSFRMALPQSQRDRLERLLKYHAPGKVRYTLPALYSVEPGKSEGDPEMDNPETFTLLALPSLGIHLPGMERWVRYEIRYRHVDLTLLGRQTMGQYLSRMKYRHLQSKSRRLRGRRLARMSFFRKHNPKDYNHIE
ncbi:putative tRNA(Ile)-lysidine synthase [Paramyrothecium foliicola]|nr:putative tRNA(Ile)-lysidine synthase [Paramyrothecium foliicola]